MSFITWLQTRLVAHGAQIAIDGDWGRRSIAALKAFQSHVGLHPTGVSDRATVDALRADPEGTAPVDAPIRDMPPWVAEMYRRMGLHETRDNDALAEWLKAGKYLGDPARLPWCGDAVETCFAKTLPDEPLPSNPFWAQGWAAFGRSVDGPKVGSVGVIRWSASAGHVGFVVGTDGGQVRMIGGNQSNMIRISSFDRGAFIAFRWPLTSPFMDYPPFEGDAPPAGDLSSTR